ncbi:PucR family transcriptional regulator [Clostridium sp. E02]|uniref:PucR family transcriptional regulator n=1 Tax=Clostridium sp. E02 TaxID=2487134 RepID=UPI0013DE4E53|nr:PucR family transcriptional regulator [Clostridium sp. E02]
METQVTNLYHCSRGKYNLTLHSGEAGMTNSVSWIYLAEDIQNIPFLKGGEFILTTGLFTLSGTGLYDFICSLATCNCSGVLINVGKYLQQSDLTEEIMEFCRVNHFPLLTMPWKVHLVDIMQDYSSVLLHNTRSTDQLNAAFQGSIYQTPVHENILLTLNQYGFPTTGVYRIIVIQNLKNTTRVTFSLNRMNLKYHLFEHENRQILLYLSSPSQPELFDIVDTLLFCDSITLGISNTFQSLMDISRCYKHARFALATALFRNLPMIKFDELGFFQILFTSSDPSILHQMYERYLGQLEQFDLDHDTNYINTLKIYLLSDCNLLKTASQLHTHRNTVIYRLKKIKELLNTKLDEASIKFDLMMAFYIKEYFSIS